MKNLTVLVQHSIGLLLLAIAPALLTFGLEQVLTPEAADDLRMVASSTFAAAGMLIALGVVSGVAVLIAFPFDARRMSKRQLPAPGLGKNLWMVFKFFSVPISVAVVFGISQSLLAFTAAVPPWLFAVCGVLATAFGYLLTRPLISTIVNVVVQTVRLIWRTRGAAINGRLKVSDENAPTPADLESDQTAVAPDGESRPTS